MTSVPPEGTIPEDKAFTRHRRAWIVEARFLVGVAVFFAAVCAMYWFGSYERAGSVLLIFEARLALTTIHMEMDFIWRFTKHFAPREMVEQHKPHYVHFRKHE